MHKHIIENLKFNDKYYPDLDTLNDTYKSSMLKLVKAEKLYEKK